MQSAAFTLALCLSNSLQSATFDPIVELFRLGEGDRLVIDRGGPVALAGDVNGDGLDDVIVGTGVGGVRVVFGPTSGFNGVVNATSLTGSNGFAIVADNENPSVLAGIGDINVDGIADIIVGSVSGAYVVFGRNGGFPATLDVTSLDGTNGFGISTAATAVAGIGDVNGDSLDDFIVGNATASPNGVQGAGVSYVVFGRRSAFPATLEPSALDGSTGFAVLGSEINARSGLGVNGAGDFNRDGVADFMIGAPRMAQNGELEAGEAYLLFGSAEGFPAAISLTDIDGGNGLVFVGANQEDNTGIALGGVGDLNHDGIDDIAIGAPGKGPVGSPSDYPGEAYVLFGGQFDGVARVVKADLDGNNGFSIRGIRGGVVPVEEGQPVWGDMVGQTFDTAGDINGDGMSDMILGASQTIINPLRKGNGQSYFVFGSVSAFPVELNLADLDGANGFRINGVGTVDYFGFSVSTAGDFNADSNPDVIIGASGQGESYVFYGRNTGVDRQAPVGRNTSGVISSGFAVVDFVPGVDFPIPPPRRELPSVGGLFEVTPTELEEPVAQAGSQTPVPQDPEPDGAVMNPDAPTPPTMTPNDSDNAAEPAITPADDGSNGEIKVGINGGGSVGYLLLVFWAFLLLRCARQPSTRGYPRH